MKRATTDRIRELEEQLEAAHALLDANTGIPSGVSDVWKTGTPTGGTEKHDSNSIFDVANHVNAVSTSIQDQELNKSDHALFLAIAADTQATGEREYSVEPSLAL